MYRRFIKRFAKIAAPLNRKLLKGQPERFENLEMDEIEAFQKLKAALLSPPILALPRAGYATPWIRTHPQPKSGAASCKNNRTEQSYP